MIFQLNLRLGLLNTKWWIKNGERKVGKNEIIHDNFIYRVLDNAVSNSAISFKKFKMADSRWWLGNKISTIYIIKFIIKGF